MLVAYVSIGKKLGGLKMSQLVQDSTEWEMQNVSGTWSTFGAPSCAPSISW